MERCVRASRLAAAAMGILVCGCAWRVEAAPPASTGDVDERVVEAAMAATRHLEQAESLLAQVEAECSSSKDAGEARPTCRVLQDELERRLVDHHRRLAETAFASSRYGEAERHYRLALSYAGFDPGFEARIRQAGHAPAEGAPLQGRRLYEERLGSVVQVRTDGRLGSGVVVAPDLVLTNAHVLGTGDGSGTVLTPSGEEVPFERSLKHPFADIAILRAPGLDAEPAPLGEGLALRPGDRVSLIGSPQGLAFSFSDGSVSAIGRRLDDYTTLVQFTAPISQGSSGAPLFDRSGRVAALASLFFNEGQALNFAVPIEYGLELIPLAHEL